LLERSALANEEIAEALGLKTQEQEQMAEYSGSYAFSQHLVGVEQVDQAPVA
jgi:hypothetical protein